MTSNASAGWSRKELEAVAGCLGEDLRSAGPRFSIGFTPVSESARMVASVPPSEEPPEIDDSGSGGFIEYAWDEEMDLAQKVDRLPAQVKRHLGWMHGMLGEPADTAILLSVDGHETMWLEFWSKPDHLEHLADLLEQAQDVVMETTHERWPVCPGHGHELLPRPHDDWIAWECPDTEEAVARFGRLTAPSS